MYVCFVAEQHSKKDDRKKRHDRQPGEPQYVERGKDIVGEGTSIVKKEPEDMSGLNERMEQGGSRHRGDGHSSTRRDRSPDRREKREASAERLGRDVRKKEYLERRHEGRDGNDSKAPEREDRERERRSRERETTRKERIRMIQEEMELTRRNLKEKTGKETERGSRERSLRERNDSGRDGNASRVYKREGRDRSRDRETSCRDRNDSGRREDSSSRHERREYNRGRDHDSRRDKERANSTRKDQREDERHPHGRMTSREVSSTDKRQGKAPRNYTPHSPSRSPSSSGSDRSPRRSSTRHPKRSRHDSSSSD